MFTVSKNKILMHFKSIVQLLDHFKDEKVGIEYYKKLRWNGNPICPHCGADKPYESGGRYKCSNNKCYKKFSVRVGTIFQDSPIKFRIWFAAIYLATTHKKGISSVQLSIDLNITQKTAWFLLHRIREMLRNKENTLLNAINPVEIDEAYIGGREKNKHHGKKRSEENPDLKNDGELYIEKKTVIGVIERNGNVALKHIPDNTKESITSFIEDHIPLGSKVYTDEYRAYSKLGRDHDHGTINHSLQIYVNGDIHTNTIENFWSVLKRGILGVYHQISDKHLERYLDEFAGRFNTRDLSTQGRFENFLKQSESPLPRKILIAA